MLRHGLAYESAATWKGRHLRWLDGQNFAHPAQRLAFQEMLNAVRATAERIDRLDAALIEIVPNWTLAPVVAAFQAMRGIKFVTATTMVAEVGDLRRFEHPRQLMAFLGLVIRQVVLNELRGTSVAYVKTMTTALRGYLRFLGTSGGSSMSD